MKAHHDVLCYRKGRDQPHVLKGTCHAQCRHPMRGLVRVLDAIETQVPAGRSLDAANHVEKCGLSGAVWARYSEHAAIGKSEVHIGQCLHPAEVDGHARNFQQGGCHSRTDSARWLGLPDAKRRARNRIASHAPCTITTRPPGCKTMIAMIRTPPTISEKFGNGESHC